MAAREVRFGAERLASRLGGRNRHRGPRAAGVG